MKRELIEKMFATIDKEIATRELDINSNASFSIHNGEDNCILEFYCYPKDDVKGDKFAYCFEFDSIFGELKSVKQRVYEGGKVSYCTLS